MPLVNVEERRAAYRLLEVYPEDDPGAVRGEAGGPGITVIRAICDRLAKMSTPRRAGGGPMTDAPRPGVPPAVERLIAHIAAAINVRSLYAAGHPAVAAHVERLIESVEAACAERKKERSPSSWWDGSSSSRISRSERAGFTTSNSSGSWRGGAWSA